MANLSKMLKQLDKDWANAEVKEVGGGFWKPPEGDYRVQVTNIAVELSKTSERLQVVYTLKIAEGNYAGKTFKKFDGLETQDNMSWTKGALELIGIEIPKKLSKLPEAIEAFYTDNPDGVYLDIATVPDGDFIKIYFNNVVEADEIDSGSDSSSKSEEEEVIEKEDGTEEEEEIEDILNAMDLADLLEYAEENEIALKKLDKKSAKKVRKVILEALED